MSYAGKDLLQERLMQIDAELLELLGRRGMIVQEISRMQRKHRMPHTDQVCKLHVVEQAPIDEEALRHLLQQIDRAMLNFQNAQEKPLLVSRKHQRENTVIKVKGIEIGSGSHLMIAGPCAVESYEQMRTSAAQLKAAGVSVIRGGAFKPRTSPYDFQGLGIEGLKILKEIADEFELVTVSEIVHPSHIEMAMRYIDIIQIGARNMQNFELLKAAGEAFVPVLLKRGTAATLEEFLLAAEYIVSRGNQQVILVERGIRTHERWTRNTLDISAVPILKQESHLPVLVDVSHSTGRKDIMAPCAKAALAAGADGIMVEVHPDPPSALSDANQQLSINQFIDFWGQIKKSGLFIKSPGEQIVQYLDSYTK
ncbi:bifunctional 3-deoxy-7-phosphoheptulonate synthase/chorismate mutase [Paenibacillus alkalitolerans]|uniref:bifunctional 3-deoxy-7-phosphoheptulonate synthase/chorismate mutase n=1 Tax=Paenibacillus alkalitolerans TaxID=2799335 RepID=UPI0018F62A81|nr:bifunctional 3-deoxy-7-phosphoheptulonate synthase/chorismate mutase [Paenibacillus alkalitolerans]